VAVSAGAEMEMEMEIAKVIAIETRRNIMSHPLRLLIDVVERNREIRFSSAGQYEPFGAATLGSRLSPGQAISLRASSRRGFRQSQIEELRPSMTILDSVNQCHQAPPALDPGYPRVLASTRRIYEAAEFVLVEESSHHSFGRDLKGQIWSKDL
jgi:hypothetical protein